MKPVHVCVPVLKRYDLLRGMLASIEKSTIRPEAVYVLDNGGDVARLAVALDACPVQSFVEKPKQPMGVAESWNWFIRHVPEERVIVNDDIEFAPRSIEKLAASDADLAWAAGCGFSCFLIRDSCVKKIGLFDETISPGYAYYEDEDYLQRLDGRGTREPSAKAATVDARVVHYKSQTLSSGSFLEIQEHHRKFKIAQENYMRKWGLKSI